MHNNVADLKESCPSSWLKRFIGCAKKLLFRGILFVSFPFIVAGVDGYHINVGGWHATSFPFRSMLL
ncbi:glycosyl transferase, family 31, Concanavalin A-like lectin/glucanase domain protein [Artemisia annua]|uniref:Glycosyl transferase, family 31, Concanavalin A-like lectin/glucanase domain protein n=1 Tax=Artemisia annua TaxID=35608 RepID=A0A2U1MTX6_ARTAN|nr:glycosyl transferase, family 31, Concanavalin A-like lectin/glucanase domain protein [Artemisia annua]